MLQYSDFQRFLSHGAHKLITNGTPKNTFFSNKKIYMILIHSQQMAIVVLAVVIFLSDCLREKGSVPRPDGQGRRVLDVLAAHRSRG